MLTTRPERTHRRPRMTPRETWRPPALLDAAMGRLAAARRVAVRFVASRWPGLAEVEPAAESHPGLAPGPALLERLGLAAAPEARPPSCAYTFTFAGEQPAPDGGRAPLVARVTVDRRLQVVKSSVSR